MSNRKAKRKKKKQGQLKHKQTLEKNKKDFFLILEKIAKACSAYDLFMKIPQKEINLIYNLRTHAFRVIDDEKGRIKKKDIRLSKRLVSNFMKRFEFSITEGSPKINLHDYYSAGSTFEQYLNVLKDETYPEAKELKKKFKPYLKIVQEEYLPANRMLDYALMLSLGFSKFNNYYFQYNYDLVETDNHSKYFCYKIKAYKPEIKYFKINGNKRHAYRIGFTNNQNEIEWMKLKYSDFKNTESNLDFELDVYIQSHAISRIEERLDYIFSVELNCSLFHSLIVANKIIFKGKTLIEVNFINEKAGYLVADIVENTVLIKTFLFLTNDGTPEGEKLRELAGFNCIDKKYFEIDKLSTFMHSNIGKNEKLKNIFIDAGCEGLFNITSVNNDEYKKGAKAGSLLKYLSLNE